MTRWMTAFVLAWLTIPSALPQVPDLVSERPAALSGPTQVKGGLYYIDVSEIDGATETYKATAYLDLEWKDPRLQFVSKDASKVLYYKPDTIWTPAVEVINAQKLEDQIPPVCMVASDGTVYYERRVVAVLNTQMDLRRFPFDRQQLNFVIESSSQYGSRDLNFVPDPDQSGLGNDIVSRGWTFNPLKWESGGSAICKHGPNLLAPDFHIGSEPQCRLFHFGRSYCPRWSLFF